jgi:hypothetical protein
MCQRPVRHRLLQQGASEDGVGLSVGELLEILAVLSFWAAGTRPMLASSGTRLGFGRAAFVRAAAHGGWQPLPPSLATRRGGRAVGSRGLAQPFNWS